MKNILFIMALAWVFCSCGGDVSPQKTEAQDLSNPGQSAVKDDLSKQNVVQIAVGSPDHTTLVKAVQTAGLVDALSNVGPFTVFAPVNAASRRCRPAR